jgi:hypothetical protein
VDVAVQASRGREERIAAPKEIDVAAEVPAAVLAEVDGRPLQHAVNLIHLAIVQIGERHRAVEVCGRVEGVCHNAAVDPARQRRVVVLEKAAVVQQVFGDRVVASQRAAIGPAQKRLQSDVAMQQMGKRLAAAAVTIATRLANAFAAGVATSIRRSCRVRRR